MGREGNARGVSAAGAKEHVEADAIVARGAVAAVPSRALYVKVITEAVQKIATEYVEIGQCLIDAKAELPHGDFARMIEAELPFGPRAARMLMAVAAHPVLSDRNHGSALPASWRTLYELTRLPEPVLVRALGDGTITPEMERQDVAKLHATTTKTTTTNTDTVVVEAIEYAAAAVQELEPIAAELDVMEKALAAPGLTLSEAADIARRALVIQNRAAAVTILAERRAGELLNSLELVTTADGRSPSPTDSWPAPELPLQLPAKGLYRGRRVLEVDDHGPVVVAKAAARR